MNDRLTLQVPANTESIVPASKAAESWLERRGLLPDAGLLVNLALEEIVTNCIQYGYDDAEEHLIEIVLSVTGRVLTMLVIDDGRAFDASQVPTPDLSLAIEHRPIGGLGIHLLREMTDSMTYERTEGKNRLTLTKRFA
jgi:anti-sigma regulatory factor (Ser/Thr protein kinase)